MHMQDNERIVLNPHVTLFKFSERTDGAEKVSCHPSPSLVLLFGWTDAPLLELEYYVDSLRATFSTSAIVLIETRSCFGAFQSISETELTATVEVIRSEINSTHRFQGILVHILSDDGARQYLVLHKLLAKVRDAEGPPLTRTRSALVLDSAPGAGGVAFATRSARSFHPVLRLVVIPLMILWYALDIVIRVLRQQPTLHQELRSVLNNPDLLPTITSPSETTSSRLYICSAGDPASSAAAIIAHAKEAEAKGFNVSVERYLRSPHLAHARTDPERYWGAVSRLWGRASMIGTYVFLQNAAAADGPRVIADPPVYNWARQHQCDQALGKLRQKARRRRGKMKGKPSADSPS